MSMLIRNDHLPASERFDYWREIASQVRMAPVEVRSDNRAGFRFALRYSDLGAARVSLFTATPYLVRRISAHAATATARHGQPGHRRDHAIWRAVSRKAGRAVLVLAAAQATWSVSW
jgi:hypothetical protein